MKITILPPNAYDESEVFVDLGVDATRRVLDAFVDGDEFRQVGDLRVFDGIPPDDWLVVMVPEARVQMVGIGALDSRDAPELTGRYGLRLSVTAARPGLAGLDYTSPPTSIGLDETLALAATLRPLLSLAGISARPA